MRLGLSTFLDCPPRTLSHFVAGTVGKLHASIGTSIRLPPPKNITLPTANKLGPVFQENYGRADPACVAEIKKLYAELKLEVR